MSKSKIGLCVFFLATASPTALTAESAAVARAEMAQSLGAALGCGHFRDLFWNEVYRHLLQHPHEVQTWPSPELLLENLGDAPLAQELSQALALVLKEVPEQGKLHSQAEHLEVLTAAELGDRSTLPRAQLQERLNLHFAAIEDRAQDLGLACEHGDEGRILERDRRSLSLRSLPQQGAAKVFDVYHQSCQASQVAALDKNTSSVRGISIIGTHSDGVGKKRIVRSASRLNASNPYFRSITSFEDGCRNIKAIPPIYDYGGKPYATADLNSPLDFFRNAGSGTSALGVDCSGLVFAALAASGHKLSTRTALKAISAGGVSSRMFSNPTANGLDCLDRVTFRQGQASLQRGDIIAKPGHVVMVDDLGADPFGIGSITRVQDCRSSKISRDRFDFVIFQSSPAKGGIGVHRMTIAEHLDFSSSWRKGLMHYAIKACKARFGEESSAVSSDGLAVVRHKNTSACRSQPLTFRGEACVSHCRRKE